MSEQGHYTVTLHRRRGWDRPLRRTFPFGQWAEVGFWLDEVGAGEGDSLAVTFHPLTQPLAVVGDGGRPIVDAESPELHSVRAELYETNERGLCHELGIEKAPQWEEGA